MLYLFGPKETDFINGNSDLIHHTYDEVVDRSKGFYLKFKIALDKDKSYKKIKKEMIINAHTPDGWNQFRVFDIYNHSNYVEVVATQLHYDLNYKKVFPFAISKATAQIALNLFVQNFKSDLPNFKFTSSITDVHNFSTDDDLERLDEGHNALEILNRIASRWGGELEVDGYNVKLVPKLGKFTNALLYEHKNIAEFLDETSLSEVVTRIHAVSRFRPERAEGSTEEPEEVVIKVVVDSPLIDEYAQVYEEDYTNNDARTRDELISWARLKYSTNNIDKPARSIKVETNIIDGQEINYGDDLVLKYTKHDVDEIIRCVGYQYNPNSKQYISITLGSNSKTLSSTITGSVSDSTRNQLSNIEKQVQIIRYASNNVNRVTTGPLAIPDPIEGDMWFYHPEGRPNEVELRIFQNGGWETIVSDMTGENVRKTLADLELEADALASEIEASEARATEKANQALQDAKAEDARIREELESDIGGAIDLAEQAKQDAIDKANQALTDSKAYADSEVQANKEHFDSLIEDVETDVANAQATADSAVEQIDTAVANAGFTSLDETINSVQSISNQAQTNAKTALSQSSGALEGASTALTNASQAQDDAQTAIDNAAKAQTDAQTAINNANTALSTAGSADGKADQAIAKADAIPTTVAGIIADKNLVNGSYVDSKVDTATGAWSQELVRVEGKLDGLEIGGRNLLEDSINLSRSWETDAYSVYEYLLRIDIISILPKVAIGDTITISMDIWSESNTILRVYDTNGHPSISFGRYNISVPEGNSRQSITATLTESEIVSPEWAMDVYNGNNGVKFSVSNVKIEKGTIATDWTPAPEDLYTQEEFKLFNAQYTQDVEGMTGRLTTVENNKLDGTTFQTFKQSEYQVTADKVASTVERVDTAEGKISTQGTAISQNATAIASKADKTVVDTLSGTVSTQGTAISQNASDIASKANTTTVNTLTGRVSTAESNISQNATAITQRVTTTTYNTGLGTKENSVLKQSTAPAHLNGRLWLDTSVTPNILKRSTGTAWVKATPTTASEVGAYSSSQGSALAGRVTTAETNISQTSEAITSKADKSVVDTLSGTVSTHTTTLSQHATAISSKAEQTEVDTVKGTVSTNTSTLSQHATDISARLTQSQVDNLVNNKGYSTVSYVDTEISATAGTIRTEMTAVEGKIPTYIGGRNLFRNSNFNDGIEYWTINGSGTLKDTDMGKAMLVTDAASSGGFYTQPVDLEVGSLYTVSFFAKSNSDTVKSEIYFGFLNEMSGKATALRIGTSWKKYVYTTTATLLNPNSLFHFYKSPNTGAHGYYITNVKLEKGTVPTDWTPAPEDLLHQTDFNTFKAEYEQSASGWSSKLLQIEQAGYATRTWSNQTFATPQSVTTQLSSYAKTTALNGLATESYVSSQISTTAAAIALKANQSTVDTLSGTVNTISGKVDVTAGQISSKVWNTDIQTAIDGIEIGGRNLLEDSINLNASWETSSDTYQYLLRPDIISILPKVAIGDMITISMDIWAESATEIRIYDSNANPSISFGAYRFSVPEGNSRQSITSTLVGTSKGSPQWIMDVYNSNNGVKFSVSKIKVEKGNMATDWSPAPEDATDLINHVESELTQKYDTITASVSSIDGRVATNELNLDGLTTAVQDVKTDLTGTTTLLNTTSATVSGHTSTIATLRTDVNGKATTAQFNTLNSTVNGTITRVGNAEGKITTIETSVSGLQTTVSSKASQSQVTQLENGLSSVVTDLSNVDVIQQPGATSKTFRNVHKFYNRNASISGMLRINTPITNSSMTTIRFTGYNYLSNSSTIDLTVSFYAFSATAILSHSYTNRGDFKITNVRVGRDSSGRAVILLGDTTTNWRYPSVDVEYVNISYTNPPHSWKDGWSSEITTSTTDITALTTLQGMDTQSEITQNATNINLRVKKGDVLSQINIEADRTLIQSNKLVLDADSVVFTGSAFIPSAQIESLDASKITAGTIATARLNASEIVTQGLTTNVIKSTHIETSTATIDKLFASDVMVNRLTSKTAFINSIKAVTIDASKITSGSINTARLKTTEIVSQGLSANKDSITQLVIGDDAFTSSVTNLAQQKVANELTETTTSKSVYVEETSRTDLTNLLLGGSYSSSIALDPIRTAGVLMVYVDIEPNSSGTGNGTIQVEYGGVTSSAVTVYKSLGRYEYLMSISVSADSSRGGLFKFPYSFSGPYDWGTIRGVRVEKATTVQVPVGTGAISSKISQLYDQISLALTGADGQIAHLIANASGVSIKGEIINLDGKVKMDEGFARKFMVEQMTADTVDAFSARFANAIVGNLDVNNISGNKASFVQANFQSASGNTLQLTGDGLMSMGTTYQYKLDSAGINYYASGNITGVIRSYNNEDNAYSGLQRGTSWITRPGYELHLGYGSGSEGGGGSYTVGLALNGTTGRFHLFSTIMAGSSNLYGIDVKWGSITGATTGVRIMNRQGNGGIQIDNNDIRYLGPNGWRSLNLFLS